MKTEELMKELAGHPVLKSQMSMQMQLGLPYLEKKNDRLCISFKPHRQEYKDGRLLYYPHQYEVTFVYPFKKIVYFSVVAYQHPVNAAEPVCRQDADWMIHTGNHALGELYEACDRVLGFQKKDKKVSNLSIEKYQKLYWSTAEKLGLIDLYKDQAK